jgi:hypothetical protein
MVLISFLPGDGADGADLYAASALVAGLSEIKYEIVHEYRVLGAGADTGSAMVASLCGYFH